MRATTLGRNRDPFIFVTEADELGDATNGCFVVVLHVFVREQQHVRVVTMRPPRSEVRVVRATFDEAHPADRLDVDRTRLEEPTLEKAIRRDERVSRVANGDDVPSPGRNLVVREVTLEGARLAALSPIEIEAEIGRRFDPRHDT